MSCSFVHSTIHLQKMPLGKLSVFFIRYFSKTKCKPAKKIAGQCFSTQVKAACTHSANLERETEITKIVTYPLFPLAFSIMTSQNKRLTLPPPPPTLHFFAQLVKTIYFRLIEKFDLSFFPKGSSGYGRPSSSVEYNQLPLNPVVTQSSTQLYQTGHVQTSHIESKKKLHSNFLGFKTLCHILNCV